MARVVTFGEIMLRLSPVGSRRFEQSTTLEMFFGGSEANTAVALARWGHPVRYVTRLPRSWVGDACLAYLRGSGVDTSGILREGDRLGIYFVELGRDVRPMRVLYDRAGSAFATLRPGEVPWSRHLSGAAWFHWTGITPALTEATYHVTEEAVRAAAAAGATISCDLNYRAALWRWGLSPREVMPALLQHAHVIITNGAGLERMLGMETPTVPVPTTDAEAAPWAQTAEAVARRFPHVHTVAITLRDYRSANDNVWSALLWHRGRTYRALVYHLTAIVDRVGAGDAFSAGLIHGLLTWPDAPARALAFATAAGALQHTVPGDALLADAEEVEALMRSLASRK